MTIIDQIYKKAIRDNEPYFQKGLMTAQESDMIARRNTVSYMLAKSRSINSLVGMVL